MPIISPLYRQAQIYRRQGIALDRSTLADWVGRAAFLLRPDHERLLAVLRASPKLFADETTAPVLDPGRGRTKTGQFFAYARDDRPWGGAEWRASGERKYYLSNLPAGASLKTLAAAIKARWVREQAHQQMKEELGLDHFEGRSWRGLHRHALMTMIAYAFLQYPRLEQATGEKKPAERPATADPASGPQSRPQHHHQGIHIANTSPLPKGNLETTNLIPPM